MGENKVIIVSGVSGTGKTFLIDSLLREFPLFKKLTTITTRPKRDDEIFSKNKEFVDAATFRKMVLLNKLFIVNTVFGYEYAFNINEFNTKIRESHIILELKLECLYQLKEMYKNIFSIYIYPNKLETAIENISDRNTYLERLKDIKNELNNLKNQSLPNSEMIDVMFRNCYDTASVDKFINIVKKVLANE